MVKARKIIEAPQPAWEMRIRDWTVAWSKIGFCGRPPQTGTPSVGGQVPHIPEALDPARKPRCLQNCWDRGGRALTSSKAKKVRWSQRQMVLLALNSVEQPMEDQSPETVERKGREHRGVYENMGEWRGPERKEGRGGAPTCGALPPHPPFLPLVASQNTQLRAMF